MDHTSRSFDFDHTILLRHHTLKSVSYTVKRRKFTYGENYTDKLITITL